MGYIHCVDSRVMFGVFSAEFHSPTSVSPKLSVTHTYSGVDGSGIMLILGSDFGTRNFECQWLSDESHESERLFMGGQYLEIRSIIDVDSKENYQFYMDAIKVFQTLMDGEYILHKISNSIISILIQLINNELVHGSVDMINHNGSS